jgi:hypothetical protein
LTGWISSIKHPTSKITVDQIRPQNHLSALATKSALAASSEEITGTTDYSDPDLPDWPGWIVVGLFIAFVIALFLRRTGKVP